MEAYTVQFHQRPELLDLIRVAGYEWVARLVQPYPKLLREPTVGCKVELYTMPYPGTVHIDSVAGQRILARLNYF